MKSVTEAKLADRFPDCPNTSEVWRLATRLRCDGKQAEAERMIWEHCTSMERRLQDIETRQSLTHSVPLSE